MPIPIRQTRPIAAIKNVLPKRLVITHLRRRNFSSVYFLRAGDKRNESKSKEDGFLVGWRRAQKQASYIPEAREQIRKRKEEEEAEKQRQLQLESPEQFNSEEVVDAEEPAAQRVPGYLRPVNPLSLRPSQPPFRMGEKRVYLPNFEIVLHRNEKLEPYLAVFRVPLNLSKLDLRDYLWNLYGVEILSVRSAVYMGKLKRQRKKRVGEHSVMFGPVKRTKATKKMIVQLAKPFRFPRLMNDEDKEQYVPVFCTSG